MTPSHGSNTLPRRHSFHRSCRSRTTSESDTTSKALEDSELSSSPHRNAKSNPLRRHQSQAVMWYTTVPQSLVPHQLGSRHEPTRRSLRHSRMLVMSKTGTKVQRKYLPPVIEKHKLGSYLALSQLLLGVVMSSIAVWLIFWWPYLSVNEIQHYTGIPTLIAGWANLVLTTCCRYSYPGTRISGCIIPIKTSYIVMDLAMSLVACICCTVAFILQTFQLYLLYLAIPTCHERSFSGDPEWLTDIFIWKRHQFDLECNCQIVNLNLTLQYPAMECYEVKRILPVFITLTSSLNFISVFIGVWYIGLVILGKRKNYGKTPNLEDPETKDPMLSKN